LPEKLYSMHTDQTHDFKFPPRATCIMWKWINGRDICGNYRYRWDLSNFLTEISVSIV